MIALMCRTPIQVFRAIQIKYEMYPDSKGDIFLFSTFQGYKRIGENIKKTGVFDNVYFIEEKEYTFDKLSIPKAYFCSSYFKRILQNKMYDKIFSFNIYGTYNFLAYNVLIRNNSKMEFIMVEDGPNTYPLIEEKTFNIRYLYPLIGIKNPYKNIKKWYFSEPKEMNPFGHAPKHKLPVINRSDAKFKAVINKVFDYKHNNELCNSKIIFMEECYVNDGLLNKDKDISIFEKIKEKYSNEKAIVKLHPRSKENRFKLKFNVMESIGIPWEVYVLNIPMNNKIIISLSCTTMISSKLLYDEEPLVLLLFPLLEKEILTVKTGEIYLDNERKGYIYNQKNIYNDKNRFMIVDNIEECFSVLDKWIESEK